MQQPSAHRSADFARAFEAISLEALNAKAAMLERLDNKYVIAAPVLQRASERFAELFDVLDIKGTRSFGYETWYFDDAERRSYFDHLQGRRRRAKIRVRRYVDAGLCFVEVKLKHARGITVKKRLPYPVDMYGRFNDSAYAHVRKSFKDLYDIEFSRPLERVLEIYYERTTLVAKEGGERMTIDSHLKFGADHAVRSIRRDLYIVETKSSNGNGVADKILRALHQHPTPGCSKYCVGMASTQSVSRYNKFLPALRKLGAQPGQRSEPGPGSLAERLAAMAPAKS